MSAPTWRAWSHRAYLVGMPGAGKSTLMRMVTEGLPYIERRAPIGHMLYFDPARDPRHTKRPEPLGMQLGNTHAEFPGTDRLSMAVQPKAIDLVAAFSATFPGTVVVAEGDRLATRGFLEAFGGQLVWLDTPPFVCEARRALRSTDPNGRWVAGRETKVRNLLELPHTRLDGDLEPRELLEQAAELVPAFARLACLP